MSDTENSNDNAEQLHFNGINDFVQNILNKIVLSLTTWIVTEFQFWTGRFASIVKLGWSGLLHAFYMSFVILRFTLLEAVKIVIRGSQMCQLSGLFKMAFLLILNIFKGAFQAFMDLWEIPDPLDEEEINTDEDTDAECDTSDEDDISKLIDAYDG